MMKSLAKSMLGAAMVGAPVGAPFVILIPAALLDIIGKSLIFFFPFAALAAFLYLLTAFEMIFNPA